MIDLPENVETTKIKGFPALRNTDTKYAISNTGPGKFVGYADDIPSFFFIRDDEEEDLSKLLVEWLEKRRHPIELKDFTWLN